MTTEAVNVEPSLLTMYTTSTCGYCVRLKTLLDRAGITFDEVNIEQDDTASQFVQNVNGGNKTVPTVVFPNGTTLVNPSLAQVQAHIAG